MSDASLRNVAAASLVIGALLGVGGTFTPSAELRALAWGADGVALVLGSALLAVHHVRRGNEQLAAGFLVFLAGQALIASGSGMDIEATGPSLAAGSGLWAAGLALVSASPRMPSVVRLTGTIAAVLLAITASKALLGADLNDLSTPLPFFAYPFLAATLIGWAWVHRRPA